MTTRLTADGKRDPDAMIQKMPDGVDSKFRMVLLLARRAEQLMRGARPKMEQERALKPTRLAAKEFEENRVQWALGPEGGVLDAAAEESVLDDVSEEQTAV
jgi:DNA-directed RNA polymerase omega subunit